MTKLPDGSGFFVADIDTSAKPGNPIKWNQGNKVVQDHRTGDIIQPDTNMERAKRGLPVPWTPKMGEAEVFQPDIF
jgi:hypothetical protein